MAEEVKVNFLDDWNGSTRLKREKVLGLGGAGRHVEDVVISNFYLT